MKKCLKILLTLGLLSCTSLALATTVGLRINATNNTLDMSNTSLQVTDMAYMPATYYWHNLSMSPALSYRAPHPPTLSNSYIIETKTIYEGSVELTPGTPTSAWTTGTQLIGVAQGIYTANGVKKIVQANCTVPVNGVATWFDINIQVNSQTSIKCTVTAYQTAPFNT